MKKENKIELFHKLFGIVSLTVNGIIEFFLIYIKTGLADFKIFWYLLFPVGMVIILVTMITAEEACLTPKEYIIILYLIEAIVSGLVLYKTYEKTSLQYASAIFTAMIIEILVVVMVFIKYPMNKSQPPKNKSYMDDDKE